MKKIHFGSGLIITIFIILHLINHGFSVLGAETHIEVMNFLRKIYRNVIVESILLLAVAVQIYSGMKLFIDKRKTAKAYFEKWQIWSGFYLAMFFVIHLSAVLAGRLILKLDTNFYFGAAGLNTLPFNLFFIPYYFLAIVAFFGHISAIHHQQMTKTFLGFSPYNQSIIIQISGGCLAVFLMYSLTNEFQGFEIPATYNILIGK